jgi:sulfide:quinone oxidoreductase
MTETRHPLEVLIAGGGTAALEAVLALRDLAGDRVRITLLAPETEFVQRPMRVREPFAGPRARHFSLASFARETQIELRRDAFKWLDAAERRVHTENGEQLHYDALLLAMGARRQARLRYALTLDDRRLDEQLHGLIQDIEAGYVHRLAFVAPSTSTWPIPLYELALQTAHRAYEMNEPVSVTLVTPQDAPLAVFGAETSAAVEALLDEAGITVITATHTETHEPRELSLYPSGHVLAVDRIVALPELFGPSTPGVPKHDGHGFISVDSLCRVQGLTDVFAAGDATDFPVKLGSVAAHQADVAAAGIARLAGAPVEARKLNPDIHAVLLGGRIPLHMRARLGGMHVSGFVARTEEDWSPETKVAAHYLGPYLASHVDAESGSERSPAAA